MKKRRRDTGTGMLLGLPTALALLWLAVGAAYAAGAESSKAPDVAPVIVDGETLFQVHGIKNLTAQSRADGIAERIVRVAENPYFDAANIALVSDELAVDIMAGGIIIVSVLQPDAAAEGLSREQVATYRMDKIRAAIVHYRDRHSVRNLVTGVLLALAVSALMIGFLYGFGRMYKKAEALLNARIHRWVDLKHMRIFEFVIKGILAASLKLLRLFILVGSVYLYFGLLLSFFPWTQGFAEQLFHFVTEPIKQIGLNIWNGLPNLLFLLILLILVHYLLGILRFFFLSVEKGELVITGFYPDWAAPTYKICRFLIIAFAVVVAYPYIPGSKSPAFEGISIFLGLLFSLGSTSVVANVVAGVILTYMRGFRIGDVVKIGDTTGKVTAVSLLVTRLRTPKNLEITIPNSQLMGNQVTNYSFAAGEGRLILPTSVTIGYDAPWRQVHGLLLLAAERTGQVLRDPAPFVLQSALDDFYVKYELNVYAASSDNMPRLYSELHQNIQDAFNEYGVQIMSPHYLGDPATAKIVPRSQWHAPPAEQTIFEPGENTGSRPKTMID